MGKKQWALLSLLAVIALGSFLLFYREKKEEIVATVDGEKITETQFFEEMKRLYGKEVLNDYINRQVIFKAAKKYGIQVDQKDIEREYMKLQDGYDSEGDMTTDLKEQIGLNKDELLENVKFYLLWEELATKDVVISEEDLKAYYQEHPEQFRESTKVHLQQIVVEDKQSALQVIKELKNGSNFNTLAQEKSLDLLTACKGGDLGFIRLDDAALSPAIRNEVKNLKIGEISKPIPVEGGYAIIQIVDRREARNFPYEEVKNEIRRELALNQINSLPEVLEQLKKEMRVTIYDETLK
ncbi:peptidyl-prolyl cis-trans isomerase [Tepidibacillus fermentans]|uniref:peptidylprolyl isomerase n=1 Tax=Tepidibacillus fermentans TaxID=1281767 RepID=A0A4R3KB28_9BACI|nr:peptidyl-prolyl cis-trans isomerase [Tepidibacillus fermentans]TCS80140.1 foldase protein PrsA [Tepidibacillus fermentans]